MIRGGTAASGPAGAPWRHGSVARNRHNWALETHWAFVLRIGIGARCRLHGAVLGPHGSVESRVLE